MALIKLGGLVTQISGKIGGQTLGTSASGSYIKNSGTPRKAITLLQQTKMQRMATSAQAWRSLTDAQRAVYISASPSYPYLNRVGETKYYSGYAIFCKLRNNLLNINQNPTPAPLPLYTFSPLSGVTLIKSISTLVIQATGGTLSSATYRLFCTPCQSPGITTSYRNKFFITNVTDAQLSAGYDITALFTNKFGGIPSGCKIYFRLDGIQTTTGQTLKNMASGQCLT